MLLCERELSERRATLSAAAATATTPTSSQTKKNTTTFNPPEGAKIQLEFDNSYANFKGERKADEIGDKNFPGSLHNVAELFGNLQMIRPHLTNLHECVERFKRILKEGPDGKRCQHLPHQPCHYRVCCILSRPGTVGAPESI